MTATGVMIEFFRQNKKNHYAILAKAQEHWQRHALDDSPELFVNFLQKFYGDLVKTITNDTRESYNSFLTNFVSTVITSQISSVDWTRFAKVIMTEYEKDKKS